MEQEFHQPCPAICADNTTCTLGSVAVVELPPQSRRPAYHPIPSCSLCSGVFVVAPRHLLTCRYFPPQRAAAASQQPTPTSSSSSSSTCGGSAGYPASTVAAGATQHLATQCRPVPDVTAHFPLLPLSLQLQAPSCSTRSCCLTAPNQQQQQHLQKDS